MDTADQISFPFYVDTDKLKEFLTRFCTIEDEQDRLREEIRLLKKEYTDDFPMRGTLTAVKRVRAMRKLEAHPTQGMPRAHLQGLEVLVDTHLSALEEETRAVPDMTR